MSFRLTMIEHSDLSKSNQQATYESSTLPQDWELATRPQLKKTAPMASFPVSGQRSLSMIEYRSISRWSLGHCDLTKSRERGPGGGFISI